MLNDAENQAKRPMSDALVPVDDQIPAKRGRGRPRHVPLERDRQLVRDLAGLGLTHDNIADLVGIARPTIELRYRDELDIGHATANRRVAQRLFDLAMEGNAAALIYWTKARMGWREVQQIESSGELVIRWER